MKNTNLQFPLLQPASFCKLIELKKGIEPKSRFEKEWLKKEWLFCCSTAIEVGTWLLSRPALPLIADRGSGWPYSDMPGGDTAMDSNAEGMVRWLPSAMLLPLRADWLPLLVLLPRVGWWWRCRWWWSPWWLALWPSKELAVDAVDDVEEAAAAAIKLLKSTVELLTSWLAARPAATAAEPPFKWWWGWWWWWWPWPWPLWLLPLFVGSFRYLGFLGPRSCWTAVFC